MIMSNNLKLQNKYLKYKSKYLKFKDMFGTNRINSSSSDDKTYKIGVDDYQEYLLFMEANAEKDCMWIYNIMDRIENQDRILLSTDEFILITDKSMDLTNINTFHLLAFPNDKTLRSIRDLTAENIPLLNQMVSDGKKYIMENFNINFDEIETHFHYRPGVMLLHIHFELTNNKKYRKPLREHNVLGVVENLSIDSDYYKKVNIQYIYHVA